jgi:cell division initiation protein
MDRILPLDLERAQLRKALRGYDRDQVQALLQRAAKEMSALRGEVETLQSECSKLRQDMDNYRAQENTLKEALVLAQRTADETRAAAHKEADLIVEQARQKVTDTENQMQSKINDLRWELERLRLDKQKFLNGQRALLEAQLRDIAEMGGFAVVEGDVATQTAEA